MATKVTKTKAKASTEKRRFSTPMSEVANNFIRILSCGYTKTGKTHFALTFPEPVIVNADAGLSTDVKVNCSTEPCVFTFSRLTEDSGDDELVSWLDLRSLMLDLKYKKGTMWDEIKSYGYTPQTLVIDSGSTIADIMAHEIVADQNHMKKSGEHGETLFIEDYNLILMRFFQIMDIVKVLPMNVVMTAELAEKQDSMHRHYQAPAMTGQALGNRLPHYFDDIYLHYSEGDKDKGIKFFLTPLPTRSFEHAGSRSGIPLTPHEDPSYANFEKFYKKRARA